MNRVVEWAPRGPALLTALAGAGIGVIFGYDVGSVAGVLPAITRQFALSDLSAGWVNTIVVLTQIVGALAASRLNNALGRRRTLIAVAAGYATFAMAQALAPDFTTLEIARALLGVVIGVSLVSAPLYIAEVSPARLRGRLVALYQVTMVGGIFVTYLVNYLLSFGDNWRLVLGLPAIPALAVLCAVLALPESPRWLVLVGRVCEAGQVLRRTDPELDVERTVAAILAEGQGERMGGVADLVRKPYRHATVFIVFLGICAQINGINAVTYYSPAIFSWLGFTERGQSLLLPTIVELCAVLATLAGMTMVDRFGRRLTLLAGLGMMTTAALGTSLVFGLRAPEDAASWWGFVTILVFTCAFNGGCGSVVWVYPAETFPAQLRAAGASVMLTSALLANSLVAELFLWMVAHQGMAAIFAFFGVVGVLAFIFIVRFAPETSGRTLEEIGHGRADR